MIIEKVLNNNVVISTNKHGEDIVVMGSGVAFQKKRGDSIDESKVERIFSQKEPDVMFRIKKMLDEIPYVYFELTEEILASAKAKLNFNFEDSLYFSLMDHIYYTVQRFQEGILIKNKLLLDTKMMYRDEFELGLEAVELVNKNFKINLPEDEAAFIAIHFVNASNGSSLDQTMKQTQLVQDALKIIKNFFKIEYNETSISYYRLVTHLKFFAQRIVNESSENNYVSDEDLFILVKNRYKESFECSNRIAQFLKIEFGYSITDDEMLYLTIHIERNRN